MVKILLIEADHIEIATVVVAVAFSAILVFCFPGNVKALILTDQGFYLLVAGQAFFIGYLIP